MTKKVTMKTKLQAKGFTLIEVVVAVAILAVAAVALIDATQSNIHSMFYLQEKTVADWVAKNKLVEFQVYQKWPDLGSQDDSVEMANKEWVVRSEISKGPFDGSRNVAISVGLKNTGLGNEQIYIHTLNAVLGDPRINPGGS